MHRALLMGLAAVTWVLAGCAAVDNPVDLAAVPHDLALVFFVEVAGGGSPEDPLRQPSQYIVEVDRTLRVALGTGVSQQLYPPPTATLTPQDMDQLYRLIEQASLPKDPAAPAGPVIYHLAITAGGRTHRYATTPQASAGAVELLRYLARLRGAVADQDR